MRKKTALIVILSIIIVICGAYLIIQVLGIFSSAKKVSVDTSKYDNSQVIVNNIIEEDAEENQEYVPQHSDYGRTLEAIFINTLNSTGSDIYKSILTGCTNYGYQLNISNTQGYIIDSRSNKIENLEIVMDNATDTVKTADINYAEMLNVQYNPNSLKGSYIFTNSEQGIVNYYNDKYEVIDILLKTIADNKYDPYAVLEDNQTGSYDWASSVTAETDTSTFNGNENIEDIIVPNYFDYNSYALLNPDVVMVLGSDPRVLYRHYIQHGKEEGRPTSIGMIGQEEKNYVYVTSVGSHYHKHNCKYTSGDRQQIELDYAKQKGYKACMVCNP